MSIIKIDGKSYDIGEVELRRDAEIIYDPLTQGVMLDFSEVDDAVATKYRYSFTIEPYYGKILTDRRYQYDSFYYDITSPRSPRMVELPFGQTRITFPAKIKAVSDGLTRAVSGKSTWGGLTVTFEPTKPQRDLGGSIIPPPEPSRKMFCVNTLPVLLDTHYIWIDTEVWNDNNYWIDYQS
jgi:hypothetical protein